MTRLGLRPRLGLAWLAVAGGPLASAFLGTAPAEAADVVVEVRNYRYAPASLTVNLGDTVTWKVLEGSHTITAADGSFDPPDKSAGETFAFKFDRPGRFAYACQYDRDAGMTGVVQVRGGPTTAPSTTASGKPGAASASTATTATTATTASTTSSSTTTTTMAPVPLDAWLTPATTAPPPAIAAPPEAQPPAPGEPLTDQNAVTAVLEDDEGDHTAALLVAAGAGVGVLGAGVYAWFHRPSKYLPA